MKTPFMTLFLQKESYRLAFLQVEEIRYTFKEQTTHAYASTIEEPGPTITDPCVSDEDRTNDEHSVCVKVEGKNHASGAIFFLFCITRFTVMEAYLCSLHPDFLV